MKYLAIASLLVLSIQISLCQVTINWNEVYQTISGYGVSSAWIAPNMDDNTADLFFSEEKGIGLSLLRTRISPQGTTEIGTAQKAKARGATVWSTPWSPPPQWKSNNNVNNGGYLLPQHYKDYANYLADYYFSVKNSGVDLFAISMQNEPNFNADYESCLYTSQQFHDLINVVGPIFEQRGVGAKILFPEEIGFQWDLAQATINDPNTLKYVGVFGFHLYYLNPGTLNNHGKLVWETEVSDSQALDVSMNSALTYARKIHLAMAVTNANAFHYWWVWSQGNNNGGLLTEQHQTTKRFWMMGNFAKFVRPNYVRIGTTGSVNNVDITAYKSNSYQFTIVIINYNYNPVTINFDLNGVPSLQGLFPYVTNDQYNLQQLAFIEIRSATRFSYTASARSVTSLVNK